VADVFISYARSDDHADKTVAQRVKSELERLGLSVFLDVEGIEGGDEFNSVLDRESKSAGAIVGIWSAYALSREWLKKECRVGQKRKVLIPLLIEPVEALDIPIEFDGVQYLEFYSETEDQWKRLVRSLSRTLKRKELVREFNAADNTANVSPLIAESTTVESTNVRVVLDDLEREKIRVPDYQRDSNQWSFETKSLFIETVINNLAVPAFFFEPIIEAGKKIDEVVDGQQRLTTLQDFHQGNLRLVSADDAPYISPNSTHYAGRVFEELPIAFSDAFLSYRLPIIKLHNLGEMRLEVFRRINQGGTPLSAQDIRMAYYGLNSPSVAFIRLAGIHDPTRPSSLRFCKSAKERHSLEYPWSGRALKSWTEWWGEKETAKGQKPSEMFLWSLITAQVAELDAVLQDKSAMAALRLPYADSVDEALDVYCAQSQSEDSRSVKKRRLMSVSDISTRFFPHFQAFMDRVLRGARPDVRKSRVIANMIAATFKANESPEKIPPGKWQHMMEFIESQRAGALALKVAWPEPKGRWGGKSGTKQQMLAAVQVWDAIGRKSG
jgi:hypothetical protein